MKNKVVMLSIIMMLCVGMVFAQGKQEEPKTQIEFWGCRNPGEPLQVLMDTFADEYMAENPDVQVNITWLGRDSMTKVRTAMAGGGKAPDMVDHSITELTGALMGDNELLLNLNDLMQTKAYNEDVPFIDTYSPGVLELWEKKLGGIYVAPYYTYTSLWWYDQTLFDEIGVEVPTTWKEFLDVCETIKKSGKAVPLAIDASEADYTSYYYYWLINRLLGKGAILEASFDKTGKKWDRPEFLFAAKEIEKLIENGYFQKDYQGYMWPAGQMDWARGETAMLLMGSWIGVELRDNMPDDFRVSAFRFPTVDGKGNLNDNELHQTGFAILKDSPNAEACFDFITYCLTAENEQRITDLGAASPVIKGVKSKDYQFVVDILEETDESHLPHDGLQSDNPEFWVGVYTPMIQSLVLGDISADEFISSIKKDTIKYWKNKQ